MHRAWKWLEKEEQEKKEKARLGMSRKRQEGEDGNGRRTFEKEGCCRKEVGKRAATALSWAELRWPWATLGEGPRAWLGSGADLSQLPAFLSAH